MKKFLTKKTAAILAVLAVAVIGAFGAFAYFTADGSGTGSASVGDASAIQLSGSVAQNLYPDGPGRDVTIVVTNPGTGAQFVDEVALDGVDASNGGCDTSVFHMANVPVGADLAPGASTTVHGTLFMDDNGDNQDDCQGNSLTLNLSSN